MTDSKGFNRATEVASTEPLFCRNKRLLKADFLTAIAHAMRTVVLQIAMMQMAFGAIAMALTPQEQLADPALEARARIITADLMCPVCSGQSIDESDAELARDLRRAVRKRLLAGDTDEQVKEWLRTRYGEDIFMTPFLGAHTVALWVAPLLFFCLGAVFLFRLRRQSKMG